MKKVVDLRRKLPGIGREEKRRACAIFNDGARLMPHQIAHAVGINYWQALGIVVATESAEAAKLLLLIYHSCEPDIPVASGPYGVGLPSLPWLCPNCGEEVETYNDLGFDFEAELLADIDFQ
jgi:hypothetical protein